MKLGGLHILLTYQCLFQCDHCFVWGSPHQSGAMTLEQVEDALHQAKRAGVKSIFFEGGEPFLYYAVLKKAVHLAADMGFEVGIVSNAYWATTVPDAVEYLRPFSGRLSDLSVSSDLYHCEDVLGENPKNAVTAAKWLKVPTGVISVAQPDHASKSPCGQLPEEESDVMYRGRAARALASRAPKHLWGEFDACPHEDLCEPGRVHLDPFGNIHICQGLVIGNLFDKSLLQICDEYDPASHPICGPLFSGGPAALVAEYNLPHDSSYADACHLCYEARNALRSRFPGLLTPDQMYGVME